MDEFVYLGVLRMRERSAAVERVNRQAWKMEGQGIEMQPRRRFPRLRGT